MKKDISHLKSAKNKLSVMGYTVKDLAEDCIVCKDKRGNCVIMTENKDNRIITSREYKSVDVIGKTGYCLVSTDTGYSIIKLSEGLNIELEEYPEIRVDTIGNTGEYRLVVTLRNGYKGLTDLQGTILIPYVFVGIHLDKEGNRYVYNCNNYNTKQKYDINGNRLETIKGNSYELI